MVKVTVYKNENHQSVGFKTLGHAGYAEAGQDIVCSAISILTINTLNSIEKFTNDKYSLNVHEENGIIDFRIKGNPSKESVLLLDAMTLGLSDMAEDKFYRNYIQLTFEEV